MFTWFCSYFVRRFGPSKVRRDFLYTYAERWVFIRCKGELEDLHISS